MMMKTLLFILGLILGLILTSVVRLIKTKFNL